MRLSCQGLDCEQKTCSGRVEFSAFGWSRSLAVEPQHLRFGGGVAESVFNPLVFLVVIIAGVLILVWPRGKVIAPFVSAAILIPMDQVVVIVGMHFPMLRILTLFGIARLVKEKIYSKGQVFSGGINKIDVTVVLFAIFTALAAILLFQQWGAVIFQLGNIYTVFSIYFLLRFLIRSKEDIVSMVRTLAYVAALIAIVMTWEMATGHNPYAILGGAQASFYDTLMQRADRFRATGCFAHPILAGTFGAILIPLFVLLWREGRKNRTLALVGIVSATMITVTSNSSTPVLAYAAGVLALCLWPVRRWMRAIRWGIAFTIVTLHLVMKAPVWHLIARIDISGGSSSYHRFMLVDQCIRHFGDWWFVGVKSTADWGWDMWDTANQYVTVCDRSGLLPFILFIGTIVYGFKYLGSARKLAESKKRQFFPWALGAALFANAIAFFGISYIDQTQVVWYGLLAAISATVFTIPKRMSVAVPRTRSEADGWISEDRLQPSHPEDERAAIDSLRLQSPHNLLTL